MIRALAVASFLLGCGGKPSVSPQRSTASASTSERDALWALVPREAVFGAVITPTGLQDLEGAAVAIKRYVDTVPELAALRPYADDVARTLGAKPSLAAVGMAPSGGLVYYSSPALGEVFVLPVIDRAKFVAAVKGTPGADGDRVGKMICKPIRDRYTCARSLEAVAALSPGDLATRLALVGQRGEIETILSLPLAQRLDVAIVIQTGRGGFVLHGAARGVPDEYRDKLGGVQPRVDDNTTAGFGAVDLRPFLPPFPSLEVVQSAPLDSLVHSIAGPLTFSVSADVPPVWNVRLPLADPALARRVVERCDLIPPLAKHGATVKAGVCNFAIPKLGLRLDAWIESSELRLGSRTATPRARASAPTPLAKLLAATDWSIALYGRGSIYAGDIAELSDPNLGMAARGLAILTEVGLGIRIDGEVVRVVFGARTIFENPGELVDQLAKLAPGRDADKVKALVARSASSPFASDVQAGWGGMVIPSFLVGIYAAIGVPAFVEYMTRSKPQPTP